MTMTSDAPLALYVEGWSAMDEIEQLLDQGRKERVATAHTALAARAKLIEAEKALSALRRSYVDAWDRAIAAGWTVRELRAVKLPEPPQEYRPKPRRRRKRDSTED